MIYDCFTFFNELDLLEIRLNELDHVVHRFVLVEATLTHQGKTKELHYEKNKERFTQFHHKIVHVVVDTYPSDAGSDAWVYEKHQRNSIIEGLKECSGEDLIMVSDVDEIPRPEKVLEAATQSGIRIFRQRMFYYFLNSLNVTVRIGENYAWNGTVMAQRKEIREGVQELRELGRLMESRFHPKFVNRVYWWLRTTLVLLKRGTKATHIPNGGWHFSYLGGVDRIIQKIESFAHAEYNEPKYKDRAALEKAIAAGEDIFGRDFQYASIPIDSTFPQYIQHNKARFPHLIATTAQDKLP